MSKKKDGSSRSGSGPRYVYLDKFERRKVTVDKMLGDLEEDQMAQGKEIKILKKKLNKSSLLIRILIVVSIINAALAITAICVSV